jgi:wyosine [tRNA(Phe)-imidazoG37] synthetase (radical SAM superfamily)
LALADLVVAKLDAPDEDLFRDINRPADGIRLVSLLDGLRRFREEYRGRLAIQVMFCEPNRDRAADIAAAVRELRPDEVQLNTPLRPSPTPPLSPQEMQEIGRAFVGLPAVSVYDARQVAVDVLHATETAARRPQGSERPAGSP